MCPGKGDDPQSLVKCKSASDPIHKIWPAFINDPSSDPTTLLPEKRSCQYFIVKIYEDNTAATKSIQKKGKIAGNQMLADLAAKQAQFTAEFEGTSIPVTKQTLEHSYSQYVADLPTFKGRSKKVNASAAPASSSTDAKTASSEASKQTSPVQTFPKESGDKLSQTLAGMAGLAITGKDPFHDQAASEGSGQKDAPFGNYINPDAITTHYGSTQRGALNTVPPWKCGDPTPYQENTAPSPFSGIIHPNIPSTTLTDKFDTERNGKGGNNISVITNYVQVTKTPKQVYEYSLAYGAFTQDSNTSGGGTAGPRNVTQRAQKQQVFAALQNMDPLHGHDDWATDYNTVWSLKPLHASNQAKSDAREPVLGELLTTQRVDFHKFSGKPSQITGVTFSFTRKLEFSVNNLQDLVSSGGMDDNGASVHTTALNALLSSKVASNNAAISIGPNKFYAKNDHAKFYGIQAHRGYFTSIRPGTQSILLNISTMTGAFYQPLRASAFLTVMKSSGRSFAEYGDLVSLLVGRSVRILYDRASHEASYDANLDVNQHRVIVEIGLAPSEQKFGEGNDRMSVLDYFVKKLGANPPPSDDFPCLNVSVKSTNANSKSKAKQIWIPAEYVALDPDQPFARRLAIPHMEEIHKVSLLAPAVTQDKIIENGFGLLNLSNATAFDNLDIKIVPELLLIPARSLKEPVLLYLDPRNGKLKKVTPRDASWNLRGVHFLRPASAKKAISTIDFRSSYRGGDRTSLANDMSNAMLILGMKVPPPTSSKYTRPGNIRSFTDQSLAQLMLSHRLDNSPGLHVVILEDNNSEPYATVKRVFDQHIGSHTVCITSAKLPRGGPNGDQLLANLCLKFNLKLRGVNHLPAAPGVQSTESVFASLFGKDTMIIGADVSHAPSSMAHCPSVAAIVASDDQNYAIFPGSMRLQASKQEFLQDLSGMIIERLLRYASVNFQLPTKIVFFRDGVGEDMFERVRAAEIPQITSAYEQARVILLGKVAENDKSRLRAYQLQLTFIIVGKRHHTRFFCKDKTQGDNKGNVNPGLIVDRVITRPKLGKDDKTFDFFLQSHAALKGTARSAHYVVLERGAFDVTQIQTFTHAFCFNYARATKGVSYAGPAYYADRLAERGTLYLKAYTDGKPVPLISKTRAEEEHKDKREGERIYGRRVAEHIQRSPEWNPRVSSPVAAGRTARINPWHPDLDISMFWL